MARKVVFYCDSPWVDENKPRAEVQTAILEYLEVDEVVFMSAKPVAGFDSGHDWEQLAEEGIVAVVLCHVNDACVYGMSLEAGALELGAYELQLDDFNRLRNLAITGQEVVTLKIVPRPRSEG